MTLLDTSALIDYLVDGAPAGHVEQLLADNDAAVSAICAFELVAGVRSEQHRRQ